VSRVSPPFFGLSRQAGTTPRRRIERTGQLGPGTLPPAGVQFLSIRLGIASISFACSLRLIAVGSSSFSLFLLHGLEPFSC